MPHRLLSPFSFANGVESPNSVWLAPMTNQASNADGTVSEDELAFLTARAAGGFGVIESCATHITEDGQGWAGEWGIYDDRHIPSWKRAADAAHEHGALLFAQLFHGGERAIHKPGSVRISAAAIGTSGTASEVRAASQADIDRVINAFVAAAVRAESAGVDGIELHGAHGYLLCQFLRADLNKRTDGWGDTLEGRARLIRTVLKEIRKRVSPEFVVGVRLSPENGGFMKGLDLDESVQTAQWLCDDGADFIHVSLWDAHKNTTKRPDEHPTTVFAQALPSTVPIISAGKLWTTEDADRQVELGASGVALGRAAITTQDWPLRVVRDGGESFRLPVSAEHLRAQALGETFVNYMKHWAGFVDVRDGGKP